MPASVSVVMTTYNSAATLESCLNSIVAVDYRPLDVIIVDNASSDATRDILRRFEPRFRVLYNRENVGFCGAQNQAIRAAQGDWLLSLNPDILLAPNFIDELIRAAERDSSVGSVTGKLLRWIPGEGDGRSRQIDSTGIYFVRNLRHFDRGAEEIDQGQFDSPEYVFGATGAAAAYRRQMVEDVSIDGQFFDEDFFAYREDADLSWRAQLLGWKCLYVPTAAACRGDIQALPAQQLCPPAQIRILAVSKEIFVKKLAIDRHILDHLPAVGGGRPRRSKNVLGRIKLSLVDFLRPPIEVPQIAHEVDARGIHSA